MRTRRQLPPSRRQIFLGLGLLLLGVVNLLTLGGMGYFTQKMWSKVQRAPVDDTEARIIANKR